METSSQHRLIFTVLASVIIHHILADSDCPDNNASLYDPTGCPTGDVPVVMLSFPPYVIFEDEGNGQSSVHGIVFDYILDSFEGCCHGNGSARMIILNTMEAGTDTDEFYEALMRADIIFPVTEKLETLLTFSGIEYTFHDIVKSHGYVLIGLIDQYNAKAKGLVLDSLYDSWPIFVLTFLLAGIAGIFIWALEFHVKNEEFPLSFTKGSYEGFWWAFISMTTVGYGDKTPRSFFGRLFGVLWILLGVIVVTMFTATVTSALTHSSSPEFTSALEGQEVAVLDDGNAENEAFYIGATPHPYEEFDNMHHDLVEETVEGIFMERLRAFYYYKDRVDDDDDGNLRVFDTVPKEITYKMALKRNTTCNFLRKNYCFRRRLENPLIDSLVKKYTTPLKSFKPSEDIEGLLSGDSEDTGIFLLIVMGVFLGLLVLGIMADILIKKSGQRLCKPVLNVKSQRTASDVNFNHVNATLRQIEGLEHNLEKLFTQVQTMKENLTSATDNSLKLAEL
ncbi:uncharacterized protein LOC144645338 [Oculina patagonica]